MTAVLGIHHVTAIASDPQRNLDFYVGLLGLRFVKRTVNFDDPHTYHFYFGDDLGRPGSIMTFFPWPRAFRGRQGTGQVAVTSFAVMPGALPFWIERLIKHGVKYEGPKKKPTGETTIAFADPDGLLLEIVADESAEARHGWTNAPGIGERDTIRGFHSVTLWEERGDDTEHVLTNILGFKDVHGERGTRRYVSGDGGAGTIVDVRTIGGFLSGQTGAGTVHHVAFRAADDSAELSLRSRVMQGGYQPTPVIDRNYFNSVYFREPGGVLFEIATDPPGFTADEPAERLGEQLKLPPKYEPMRSEIEAVLPRIHLPGSDVDAAIIDPSGGPEDVSGDALGFVHRYLAPQRNAELAGRITLLLLHGTGGDEDNLVSLGRTLLPGAALLSPRGQVTEGGALRFFRRIREGVFDQEDLARRTEDLAHFVEAATATYSLDPTGIVAVGFSNGANIAGSLLLRRPGLLKGAVLLSPMVPFEPQPLPKLDHTAVFIGAGRSDSMVPMEQTERLASILQRSGASITTHWDSGGHAITAGEITAAQRWLAERLTELKDVE
ncbi:MAG TPA: VOC family protein [Gemmatimonadaceae bacterium]|nr:VOC family protein [Gemmatimonadaceae bacterium]